jgi:hypothetical protein
MDVVRAHSVSLRATLRGRGLDHGPVSLFRRRYAPGLFSEESSGMMSPLWERSIPDFTVIDGGGPEGRDRIFAEQELRNRLHETAANMLRIIRGAGKPYELVTQLNDVVKAAIKFRDAFGHWPPSHVLSEMLAMHDDVHEMDEKHAAGRFTKEDMDRWYDDGTIDRKYAVQAIKAGVLQTIASQFVGQTLQERAGETEMRDGINQVIAAKKKSREYWDAKHPAPTRTSAKKRKPSAPRRFEIRPGKQKPDQ